MFQQFASVVASAMVENSKAEFEPTANFLVGLFENPDLQRQAEEALAKKIEQLLGPIVDEFDFDDFIEAAVNNYDFEEAIKKQLDDIDLEEYIREDLEEAIKEYDWEEQIKDYVENGDFDFDSVFTLAAANAAKKLFEEKEKQFRRACDVETARLSRLQEQVEEEFGRLGTVSGRGFWGRMKWLLLGR